MKVFWTKFALNSLAEICKYYRENVSYTIANNIREGVLSSTKQLERQPQSGPVEVLLEDLNAEYRYLVRGNYKVIYKIEGRKLYITDIFDARQDPEKIKKRNV